MTFVVLCKVSQPSRQKRKIYDGKFVTAKCSSINDGATLKNFKWRRRQRCLVCSRVFFFKGVVASNFEIVDARRNRHTKSESLKSISPKSFQARWSGGGRVAASGPAVTGTWYREFVCTSVAPIPRLVTSL